MWGPESLLSGTETLEFQASCPPSKCQPWSSSYGLWSLRGNIVTNDNLQIGFYTEYGIFPPTPGMSRAVKETVDLLKRQDIRCDLNPNGSSTREKYSLAKRWMNGHLLASKQFVMCGSTLVWRTMDRGGRYYQKLLTADISAFLQLIGKLSLSEKIDLGII